MKKNFLIFIIFSLAAAGFAKAKGSAIAGSNIVETSDSNDGSVRFGGAYAGLNLTAENEYVICSGKFYYRLGAADEWENLTQKLDVKKAVLKFRPFGNDVLEIAGGKLYSYYLPGTFFQLSEIYTGAGRWGKTGVGLSFDKSGFFGGMGIPLTESYVKFKENFGLSAAFGYDFKNLKENFPIKLSADLLFSNTKQNDNTYARDYSSSISVLYNPADFNIFKRTSVAFVFSYNAEPFVANSVFKNVSNYKLANLKKADFASVNISSNIGKVQLVLEGEAGHSKEGSLIPLYLGAQTGIPFTNWLTFKPKVFYYAVFDSDNNNASRQTIELYPRFLLNFEKWTLSAGYDFDFKQMSESDWAFEWSIPLYIEYKIGK